MKKRTVRLLENTLKGDIEIKLQDFSENPEQIKNEERKNKKVNTPAFQLMDEELITEVGSNNKSTFDNNNNNHSNKNNNTDDKKDGFLKRATLLLKSAFDFNDEHSDNNSKDIEQKKFLIKHIQSFQKFCKQEELTGDDNYNFYFMQFFEIFLIHMGFCFFGIFIVPLYRIIYGPQLIRNLGFWGKRLIKARNAQYSYWISLIITIIFSLKIYHANLQGDVNNIPDEMFFFQQIYLTISYLSILLVFLRYLIVSVKYGFFPEKYYKDIKTKILYKSNLRSNFIKNGWIEPDFSIINIYLKSAFNSNNTDYKTFFFECIGEIEENLISEITEIENEIQKGHNKKRESYTRKIKKEKKSSFRKKRNLINQSKNSAIIESQKGKESIQLNQETNNNNGNNSDYDFKNKVNELKENKKENKSLKNNIRGEEYYCSNSKIKLYMESIDEDDNDKNEHFEDALNQRNFNKVSEISDNKSKTTIFYN